MSPDGQKIWDQLLDADKADILKRPAANLSRPNRPSNECKPGGQKVNVHDTTVYDFIAANAHLLDYGEAPDDTGEGASDEEAQTLHAFLASRGNNSSPADIRNLLSTSSKRAASKLPKDRQANAHVTYTVDKHHMDKPGSLIDRGANGGVAGADVHVIASTHRPLMILERMPVMKKPRPCMPSLQAVAITLHQQTFATYCRRHRSERPVNCRRIIKRMLMSPTL